MNCKFVVRPMQSNITGINYYLLVRYCFQRLVFFLPVLYLFLSVTFSLTIMSNKDDFEEKHLLSTLE